MRLAEEDIIPYEIARDWLERNKPKPEIPQQIQLDIPEYEPLHKTPEDDSIIIIQL